MLTPSVYIASIFEGGPLRDEKLSRTEADRLEIEIREQRKEEFKQALRELLKECPEELYSCVLEVVKRLRDDGHRELGRRVLGIVATLGILALLGLAVIGHWWTRS